MSNVLGSNPIVIDSTGLITANKLKIERIKWLTPGNTNTALLNDAAGGNIVWKHVTGGSAPEAVMDGIGGIWFNGLYCTTLGGGTLYVYLTQDF